MGIKAEKIKKAIEEKLGETNVKVWYVPIHGPCIEMQGYAGGWFWSSDEYGGDVLGRNFTIAMEMIDLKAHLRSKNLE